MANVSLKDCSDTEDGQKWTVMADGRIALTASSPRKFFKLFRRSVSELIPKIEECLDLQYMKATANNPVGLYACAGLGNAGAGDKGINWPLANATA